MPSLHGKNDLLGFAAALVVEQKPSVNSLICAFLTLYRTRSHQTQCPPLELIGVLLGKCLRVGNRHRFSNYLIGLTDFWTKSIR